jgi:hypothetical protein
MARAGGSAWIALAVVIVLILVTVPTGSAAPASRAFGGPSVVSRTTSGSSPGPEAVLPDSGTAPTVACLAVPRGAPCYASDDQPTVDLLSNSSDSGARFAINVTLPSGGTDSASALENFWVGLWVTGAPCAVDGASYLRVELFPPDSPYVAPTSPNWTVRAPVEALVPAGSCDPLCQNATAVTTLGGVPVCEDNIVLGGGDPTSSSVGQFAPGDRLRISAWGDVEGLQPLGIWANDSSDPSESAHWSYNASDTTTGQAVEPRYNVSNASDGGWSTPDDVAFGWTNCPTSAGITSCNSYDAASVGVAGLPTVSAAEFFNATSASMTAYPWIATASTSGGCSGSPSLASCADFASFGGTGSYPSLQIVRVGSGAAWRIGGSAGVLEGYGGASAEFSSTGNTAVLAPADVVVDSSNGSAGVATVNVTVADPRGVVAVQAESYWCTGIGPALVVAQQSVSTPGATLANVSVALNLSSENGPLTYWISERSTGDIWSPGVGGNLSMTGGTGSCVVPPPNAPSVGATNVSPVAGGYHLNWSENSGGILGFAVTAAPIGGGTSVTQSLGDVGATTILGLSLAHHYNLTVAARSLTGASASSYTLPSAAPLAPFSVAASADPGPLWHGAPPTDLDLAFTGGAVPYQVTVTVGNGTAVSSNTSSNATVVPLAVAAGVGVVTATVTVTDADGVPAWAGPILWDVWTGPLAPSASADAGQGTVGVTWSPSVSPASAVQRYAVYLTANLSQSSSSYLAGVGNTTSDSPLGPILLWNSTGDSVAVPWPNNVTAYAVVVPYDAFGAGFASSAPLVATPAPLVVGPITGGPGGPAPYTAEYSTFVTTGTNDPVDESVYSFPGFQFQQANLTPDGPNALWMNTTATISTLGVAVVLLHVSDAFGATAIGSTSVLVTTGAAPSVSAQANPEPAYVGVPVQFKASATGTGPFVYDWIFGDGSNGSGAAAEHVYETSGTFTATVVVTDNGTGAETSTLVPETVYALPRVAIVTSAGPDGSDSFSFHAVMIGGSGNGTFVWAFGDGSVGRGANVTHDYGTPGQVIVNVTATDASLRTAFANTTLSVPALTAGGGGSSSNGEFTLLADAALVAAVAGWLVVGVLLLRVRADSRAAQETDEDEFDDP